MPMRQLRSCDFCGGDAAGVYEVLPPELSPTEAEQRRIVLCSNCAETLETVVDPLLERLGVETGDDTSGSDAGSPASEGAARAEPSRSETASPAETTTVETDDASPASERVDVNRSEDDSPFVPDDPADSPPDRSTTADATGDGAVQWNGGEPTASAADGDGPDGATDPASDADESRGAPDGNADGPNGSGAAAADRSDEPEDFRTVMRLLANREFPVERDAIVELAASAYELDAQHVHRILDHAVDRGVLAEDGGTLTRN
jgi:hypothetical protein